MRRLRTLICCVALLTALVPVAASADNSKAHRQSEVANAAAQLALAEQQAIDLANDAAMNAANEREIALLKSEAFRQMQLDNTANSAALQQLATQLAAAIRNAGQANAAKEIAILQIKANALIAKADASVANAIAIGNTDEIANAQAQSDMLHQLADLMTGAQAQQAMSNSRLIAENAASALETNAIVQDQNAVAMGANELLAADTALNAGQLNAENSVVIGETRGEALIEHAEASLANAEAMEAEATE